MAIYRHFNKVDRVIYIKKTMIRLVLFVFITAMFTGCASKQLESGQVTSVMQLPSGKIISIGDTRDMVTKITGKDEGDGADFADGVQRTGYWNTPGIYVDYYEDVVVAIRITGDGKWAIAGGVRSDMDKTEVEQIYASNILKETGLKGGILLSYDENLNPVAVDRYAPYTVTISFEQALDHNDNPIPGKEVVDTITIESNLWMPDDYEFDY